MQTLTDLINNIEETFLPAVDSAYRIFPAVRSVAEVADNLLERFLGNDYEDDEGDDEPEENDSIPPDFGLQLGDHIYWQGASSIYRGMILSIDLLEKKAFILWGDLGSTSWVPIDELISTEQAPPIHPDAMKDDFPEYPPFAVGDIVEDILNGEGSPGKGVVRYIKEGGSERAPLNKYLVDWDWEDDEDGEDLSYEYQFNLKLVKQDV